MSSLKTRLLVALLATVLLNWALWFSLQAVDMGRLHTGLWDANLRDVAQKIVVTMPRTLSPLGSAKGYALPDDAPDDKDGLAMQVWQNTDSGPQLALRSPEAPTYPLAPDFRAGYTDSTQHGQEWRVYTLHDRDQLIWVQVAHTREQRRAKFLEWFSSSLTADAVLFCLLLLSLFCVLNQGLKRMDKASRLIRQRDPFNLTPLPTHGVPDELQPLLHAVNDLLERLDTAMSRERRLIADAAHELRTPLAALTTQAELARDIASPEGKNAALEKLLQTARRATRLSEQLLDQARLDALEQLAHTELDLSEVVALIVRDYESAAREKRQHIRLDVQHCRIRGDIDTLGILVRNLIDNAIRYTPCAGSIHVRCGPLEQGRGGVLVVSDSGPGVAESERMRIFERFYRAQGKAPGGSGIGLSLVAQIAQLHGADIACDVGDEGVGLRITIRFGA